MDCESNLYQSLSCASLVRVIWVVYYDCTIFVLPLWWIFCYWDDLWDEFGSCFWCIDRCICYPFLYACYDQTSTWGCMWVCVH
jgi:hypothetical protein